MTNRTSMARDLFLLCALLAGLGFGSARVEAQAKPYTFEQVLTMVEGGLGTEYVMEQVRMACIDFRLDTQALGRLRAAGAGDEFVAALRSVCYRPARAVSPGGAAVRSLLVPGLGQFSSRRPVLGALFLSAAGGSLAAGALSKDVTQICEVPATGRCPADNVLDEDEKPRFTLGAAGYAAVGVVAALEAYLSASRAGRSRAAEPRAEERTGVRFEVPVVARAGEELRLELIRMRF